MFLKVGEYRSSLDFLVHFATIRVSPQHLPGNSSMHRFRDFNGTPPLPRPTHHLPGSRGKVRVLRRRAMAHRNLHHPDDARIPNPTDPATPAVEHGVRPTSRDYDLDRNYQAYLDALNRAMESR